MENQIQKPSMPLIGEKAPDFTQQSTHGPITFSEFNKGSWVILFSHPADFTPVCTTELSEFAVDKEFYAAHNTKLMGLSIDSVHSHLAWVNNVREKTGVYMDFPILADLDMKVANLYGMLHPGASATAAVRAVFFIDPAGIVRLVLYYPLNIGRNMDEVKRILVALQTADEKSVALPANWRPGDKAIVPPPKTLAEMDDRIASTEYEQIDFYLSKKQI